LASEVRYAPSNLTEKPLEMVFIRAPFIEEVGSQVEVLAREGGRPVLVRQGKILVATFHPELTDDTTVHEYFLRMAAEPAQVAAVPAPAGSAVSH
jgi:5'-phosphate synthase pdxT subunit